MEGYESFPFGTKAEFLGASKIEKGLSQFRVYRVAENRRLLKHDRPGRWNDNDLANDFFARSLHFTTQPNMAKEYAQNEKNVLFEERGVDFLEDLRHLDSDGVRLLLFSHNDLVKLGDIKLGKVPKVEARNFLEQRTFRPSEVSPRLLRTKAEIVVLLPEGMDTLPLRQSKKQRIKSLQDKGPNQIPQGQFHSKVREIQKRPNPVLRKLNQKRKKLEVERSSLFGQILSDNSSEESKTTKERIKQIDELLKENRRQADRNRL